MRKPWEEGGSSGLWRKVDERVPGAGGRLRRSRGWEGVSRAVAGHSGGRHAVGRASCGALSGDRRLRLGGGAEGRHGAGGLPLGRRVGGGGSLLESEPGWLWRESGAGGAGGGWRAECEGRSRRRCGGEGGGGRGLLDKLGKICKRGRGRGVKLAASAGGVCKHSHVIPNPRPDVGGGLPGWGVGNTDRMWDGWAEVAEKSGLILQPQSLCLAC